MFHWCSNCNNEWLILTPAMSLRSNVPKPSLRPWVMMSQQEDRMQSHSLQLLQFHVTIGRALAKSELAFPFWWELLAFVHEHGSSATPNWIWVVTDSFEEMWIDWLLWDWSYMDLPVTIWILRFGPMSKSKANLIWKRFGHFFPL